jgi:Putative MetA-pathway of phenol degradation
LITRFKRLAVRFLIVLGATFGSLAHGQEMEPRAFSPAPVGSQFVVITYGHQSGDVLLDSSLPLRDVEVKFNAASIGYGRTFRLVDRQANVAVLFPYIWGTASGTVFEDQVNVRRSGGGDVRARFSILLKGGEALQRSEFASRKPKTIIGAGLSVVIPTGQYDPARLVNPGSNRWAFKPEIGISKPIGRWTMEAMGGAWLFTSNQNFFGGFQREQESLFSLQGHLIYTLRRRMWVSVNGTYFSGGRTKINGVLNEDRQKNARVGAIFSLPLTQQQSLKFAWAKGVTTRIGGNLNLFAVGWSYVW